MNKSICCISSKRDWHLGYQLCKRVKDKTGIEITVLNSSDTTVDFDVVVYIHTKNAIEDPQILNWLKEASDLNKTFIPVIIGGNWLSNKLEILKYKGPNLRSSFLQLRKDEDYYELCNYLTSFVGKELIGDAYGAIVDFVFDVDCKILKDKVVIAEVPANIKTPVTLYLGTHNLICQPVIDSLMGKEEVVEIKDLNKRLSIEYNFCERVAVSSDLKCDVYQNDRLLARINPKDTCHLPLIAGLSNIRFQCVDFQDISKTITVEIAHGSNKPIVAQFTANVKLASDLSCEIYQNNRYMATITKNQPQNVSLFLGISDVLFKSIDFPGVSKQVHTIVNNRSNNLSAKFRSKLKVQTDTDCYLFQNNILVDELKANCEKAVSLFLGESDLMFKCIENPQYYSQMRVRILERNNGSIYAALKVTLRIKSDVDGVLIDNGKELLSLNAYQSHYIRVYKGQHEYCVVDKKNPNNYSYKKLNATYDTTLPFYIERIRFLNKRELVYIPDDSRQRYSQLYSEWSTLKGKLMSSDNVSAEDINNLNILNFEIEQIVDQALKRKAIQEVMGLLQSPIQNLILSLNSVPNTVLGLLTALENY